jgi:hypothetical protein
MNRPEIFEAVRVAFDRGRWVLLTNGDGSPREITIDLVERPDDLWAGEFVECSARFSEPPPSAYAAHLPPTPAHPEPPLTAEEEDLVGKASAHLFARGVPAEHDAMMRVRRRLRYLERREDIGKWRPFTTDDQKPMSEIGDALRMATDDHGPAIPAQGSSASYAAPLPPGPIVYEFALQDCTQKGGSVPYSLEGVRLSDAPDSDMATRADWVHVYDRVTRERRTLKRPPADRILTGLRDVAADLRGKGHAESVRAFHDHQAKRGDPVEPPFGCGSGNPSPEQVRSLFVGVEAEVGAIVDPVPSVGPLTSTDGLKAGDVLRVIRAEKFGGMGGWENGDIATVIEAYGPGKDLGGASGSVVVTRVANGEHYQYHADRFAFVARPGVWMPWEGGENPVPGLSVRIRWRHPRPIAGDRVFPSDRIGWHDPTITDYMVVDTPPAPSDT